MNLTSKALSFDFWDIATISLNIAFLTSVSIILDVYTMSLNANDDQSPTFGLLRAQIRNTQILETVLGQT